MLGVGLKLANKKRKLKSPVLASRELNYASMRRLCPITMQNPGIQGNTVKLITFDLG